MRIQFPLAAVAVVLAITTPALAAGTTTPVTVTGGHSTVHVTPDRVAEIPFRLVSCATAASCTAPMALYSRAGTRISQDAAAAFLPSDRTTLFPGLRLTPAGWRAVRHARRLLTRLVVTLPAGGRELLGYETLLAPAAGQRPWCAGLLHRLAPPCHGSFRSAIF